MLKKFTPTKSKSKETIFKIYNSWNFNAYVNVLFAAFCLIVDTADIKSLQKIQRRQMSV